MTDQKLINLTEITVLQLKPPNIKYRIVWFVTAIALGLLIAQAGLPLIAMNIGIAIFAGLSGNWSP